MKSCGCGPIQGSSGGTCGIVTGSIPVGALKAGTRPTPMCLLEKPPVPGGPGLGGCGCGCKSASAFGAGSDGTIADGPADAVAPPNVAGVATADAAQYQLKTLMMPFIPGIAVGPGFINPKTGSLMIQLVPPSAGDMVAMPVFSYNSCEDGPCLQIGSRTWPAR